jgi:hypothetical protein
VPPGVEDQAHGRAHQESHPPTHYCHKIQHR